MDTKQPKPLYLLEFPDFSMFLGTTSRRNTVRHRMSPKTVKSQGAQANIMVWAAFCYQKSGPPSKYNGLGCFVLIESQERRANIMAWVVVFVIKSQATQVNKMVWAFFFLHHQLLAYRVNILEATR